jgi:hypothetical protein
MNNYLVYEDKIKELCNYLLGPVYSLKWNPLIMVNYFNY